MDHPSRYLRLRLTQCDGRPKLHEHQIATLRGLLASPGVSVDAWWQLSRAELLDRYANQTRLYRALGDDRLCGVAAAFVRAIEPTQTPAELARALNAAVASTSAVYRRTASCQDALRSLVLVLLEWATDGDASARHWQLEKLRQFWRVLQHNDPGCSWQRISEYPPYRNCLPFDRAGLSLLGRWLHQAIGAMLVELPPAEPKPHIEELATAPGAAVPTATLEQAASVYHDLYDRARQAEQHQLVEICEQVFALERQADGVTDFLCKLLEHDIDAALARANAAILAADALAHCAELSQPHIETHYRLLDETLARARTPTEIAYEVLRLEECFAVESMWQLILLRYAMRPVMAVLQYELQPTEARRETVVNSYRVTHELLADWAELLAAPRLWSFFRQMLFPRVQSLLRSDPVVAYRGEVGWDLLANHRQHALEHVTAYVSSRGFEGAAMDAEIDRLVGERFSTPEAMRDHVTSLFTLATAGEVFDAAPAPRRVIYWGQDVSINELESALSSPRRPC